MKRELLVMFFLLILSVSYGQSDSTRLTCRHKWKYLMTDIKIKGRLVYFLPTAGCGYSISASLSIIKTIKGDTIRVLDLCDMRKNIEANTMVYLLPNKRATKRASVIPVDERGDCNIMNTFYGELSLE